MRAAKRGGDADLIERPAGADGIIREFRRSCLSKAFLALPVSAPRARGHAEFVDRRCWATHGAASLQLLRRPRFVFLPLGTSQSERIDGPDSAGGARVGLVSVQFPMQPTPGMIGVSKRVGNVSMFHDALLPPDDGASIRPIEPVVGADPEGDEQRREMSGEGGDDDNDDDALVTAGVMQY